MILVERCRIAEVLASEELIAEYGAECSIPGIGLINPHHDLYGFLDRSGITQSFMVKEDGEKIGFAIVLTPIMPHYSKRVASLESIFITASRRATGAGLQLMREVEKHAKDEECVGILYSAPVGGALERLLAASKEYQRTNAVFYRGFA